MEQISFLEESSHEKMIRQMKIAISKGIVPGAKVVIDEDYKNVYSISNIFLGSDGLEVRLSGRNGLLGWNITSERLKVIGFNLCLLRIKQGGYYE